MFELPTTSSARSRCQHLQSIIDELASIVTETRAQPLSELSSDEMEMLVDDVARSNVLRTVEVVKSRSSVIGDAVEDGQVRVAGALYDVKSSFSRVNS